MVVVGSNMQDSDVLRTLLDSKCESLVYVNKSDPRDKNTVTQTNLNMLTEKETRVR